MAFIKRGDGKILSVVQQEQEEESRKKTAKEQSESIDTSQNNPKKLGK